jgi:hypothetical protein
MTCMAAAIYSAVCNGSGTCAPSKITECAPYACDGAACGTSCTEQNDCAPMHKCNNGMCEPNSGGANTTAAATPSR